MQVAMFACQVAQIVIFVRQVVGFLNLVFDKSWMEKYVFIICVLDFKHSLHMRISANHTNTSSGYWALVIVWIRIVGFMRVWTVSGSGRFNDRWSWFSKKSQVSWNSNVLLKRNKWCFSCYIMRMLNSIGRSRERRNYYWFVPNTRIINTSCRTFK